MLLKELVTWLGDGFAVGKIIWVEPDMLLVEPVTWLGESFASCGTSYLATRGNFWFW